MPPALDIVHDVPAPSWAELVASVATARDLTAALSGGVSRTTLTAQQRRDMGLALANLHYAIGQCAAAVGLVVADRPSAGV